MLQLVGYDLETPPNRIHDLEKALKACGDARNMPYGPRFVDTEMEPEAVLDTTLNHIGKSHVDKLLVLPVKQEGYWAQRNLQMDYPWLTDHLGEENTAPLLALAYTLHGTKGHGHDHDALLGEIEALPIYREDGFRHPLFALSFLDTDRTPKAICDEVAKSLKDRAGRPNLDELLVIPVEAHGAHHGMEKDLRWFTKHGMHLTEVPLAA